MQSVQDISVQEPTVQCMSVQTQRGCCSYCRKPGHNISKCNCPSKRKMDKVMMKVTAITSIFPQMGDLFIKSKLKKLSSKQLQVLLYLFEIPPSKKYLMSCKDGRLELLTDCYYNIISSQENNEELNNYVIKIYNDLQFDAMNPLSVPNIKFLRQCADLAYTITWEPTLYFQISSWIAEKMEAYHRDYLKFLQENEYRSHRFDIFCCVEQTDEPYEPFDCPICQEEITEQANCVKINCKHQFCTTCIEGQLEAASKKRVKIDPTCAMCRSPISDIYFNSYALAEPIHEKYIHKDRVLMILSNM